MAQSTSTARSGFFLGIIAALGGTTLAVLAQSIAFGGVKGYSPPRSDTSYAVQEQLLQQIGLIFLIFGLLLILISFREILCTSTGDGQNKIGNKVGT